MNAAATPSHDLQRLWFSTQRRPWSSLAIVPLASGGSVHFVAEALASLGTLQSRAPVEVLNAERTTPASCVWQLRALEASVGSGTRVIVLLDPLLHNEAGIPLAMAADALLIGVELGFATAEAMRRTLDLVGRDRVLGTIALRSARAA